MTAFRAMPDRRVVLRSLAGASLALPGILGQLLAADANPLAARRPHFPAKAKRVIFLYSTGGVSHMDTFDPKPDAPAEHRTPFDTIDTAARGMLPFSTGW